MTNPATTDELKEALDNFSHLSRKCVRILDMWMDVAATSIKSPGKLTGSEFNRTGELLMDVHQRLLTEEKRLKGEIYIGELRRRTKAT
jgi:hypothetical protein